MILKLYSNINSIPINVLDKIKLFDFEQIYDFLYDPYTFNIGIVFDEGEKEFDELINKVVGFGIIRVVNEFKMAMNQDLSKFKKTKILELLMSKAIKLKSCNDVIVSLSFPEDVEEMEQYENVLEKHYGFQLDSGIVLRRE